MTHDETSSIAQAFLTMLGTHADPDEIAALFSSDLEWEIPGDSGALPWIGRKTGRGTVVDFIRDTGSLLEPLRFKVHEILGAKTER